MASKQFYEPLTNLYSKTQKNTVSKLYSGVIMGLLLFLVIVIVTIGIELLLGADDWIGTFTHDMRGLGIVAGLILTLEVWGLLPHPTNDVSED